MSSHDSINDEKVNVHPHEHEEESTQHVNKWYDKQNTLFGFKLFPYSHAMTQIIMVSFVCFLCPGMFNALNGLGGSGMLDTSTSANANVALYSTFATFGFFGGTICNKLGVNLTMAFGGIGYALYSGSLLAYKHIENEGFVIFAGAFLGVCAGCLWAAQGSIIMSYPSEDSKGKAIMVFWIIFNLGAVIGSCVPLAENINNQGTSVGDGTYAAFLALMAVGAVLACFLLPVSKVWKADGTRVIYQKAPSWKSELLALWNLLYSEPTKILPLFPMFFASNWFYTYQFNCVNAPRFDIRTRSLNELLYWFMQMIGAGIMGFLLDWKRFTRKTRARVGWVFIMILTLVIWGGGLKFQLPYTRDNLATAVTELDFQDGGYIGPMFLYMFYGIFDALWQTYVYWVMGALSNSSRKTALYAGFYKGIQSAGAAIVWRLDAIKIPYMNLFISSWVLLIASLIFAVPVIFMKVVEHTNEEEDLKFSDETREDIHEAEVKVDAV